MMSEVMCLQRIAERSRNDPDGTKDASWAAETWQESFWPGFAASFPVVAAGRCKKGMEITGDGA